MESFVYTSVTADGYPVAVCGLCSDHRSVVCQEAFSVLENINFGVYTSGFTIDYRLGELVNGCIKEIAPFIFLLGASIEVNDAECSTGGIFGAPNGEYISSEEMFIERENFVSGFKPGKGAFGAVVHEENSSSKIKEAFKNSFEGGINAVCFYKELMKVSDRFIMITDGSGRDSYGTAANEDHFITLKEVKSRHLEQKEFFGLKRIGVIGGTFDPVHNGHLIAAQTVCDQLDLDKIIFVPTGNTTYKEAENVSSGEARYRMTSLAVESNSMFCVSSIEIDNAGISYTVDTIEKIRHCCDVDAKIFFILGADVISAVSGWKGFHRLAQMCEFVAVTRPGYSQRELQKNSLFQNSCAKVLFLEVPALDISSSYIRAAVREGKSIKYLLPESVEKYIDLHGLYKNKKKPCREDLNLDRILKLIY